MSNPEAPAEGQDLPAASEIGTATVPSHKEQYYMSGTGDCIGSGSSGKVKSVIEKVIGRPKIFKITVECSRCEKVLESTTMYPKPVLK